MAAFDPDPEVAGKYLPANLKVCEMKIMYCIGDHGCLKMEQTKIV